MRAVIAPQHFKESRTGLEVAHSMEVGLKRVWPDAKCVIIPVADGGDGTLETLVEYSNGRIIETEVMGPLGEKVTAKWGSIGDGTTAVIEMAQAAGLALVKREKRDPLTATTFGVGQLFKAAMDSGHRRLIVGIGGSATNDGGAGFAEALGAKLMDENGNQLERGGAALARLSRIDVSEMDERLSAIYIDVACDVVNPLCGETGAAAIFGPQKGATPEDVQELDAALKHFNVILERDLGKSVANINGAGAAGGLGAGLMAFANANLRSGADIVMEAIGLEKVLADADLVFVGEGSIDHSTVFNKSPAAVAKLAKRYNLPVMGICGSLGEGYKDVNLHGIDAVFSIVNRPMELSEAMNRTDELVASATEEACRAFDAGMRMNRSKRDDRE